MAEILPKTFTRVPRLIFASAPRAVVRARVQWGKLYGNISQSFFNGFGRNLGLHRSKFIAEYESVKKSAVRYLQIGQNGPVLGGDADFAQQKSENFRETYLGHFSTDLDEIWVCIGANSL